MNRSGAVLGSILHYAGCSLRDIIVVCDSLDLESGVCRLKTKGSSAGHKGLASILHYAGTHEIMRLFIGIGRSRDIPVVEYVLSKPGGEEMKKLSAGINRAASAILQLLEKSPQEVMNVLNRRTVET
jgi:peptidyl-tRNA hydrolase, PTH1 family